MREDTENRTAVRMPICQMPVTRIGLNCPFGGFEIEGPRLMRAIRTDFDLDLTVGGLKALPRRCSWEGRQRHRNYTVPICVFTSYGSNHSNPDHSADLIAFPRKAGRRFKAGYKTAALQGLE